MQRMKFFPKAILFGVVLSLFGVTSSRPLFAEDAATTALLYVSPEGNDALEGSREQPLGTVQAALSRLTERGGTIALLAGRYTEAVVIPPRSGPGRVTLCAAPGEKAVFDGSIEATGWEAADAGLYRVPLLPEVANLNLNLWEDLNRVRYQRQLDPRGVRAWPGSFCVLESGHLLVHTRDGKDPGALHLRMSWKTTAIRVNSSGVAIRNIRFQNYLGDRYAAAIVLSAPRKDLQVADCEMTNMVRGIVIQARAQQVEISRCQISDVGTGVLNMGIDVAVRDCVIQAAMGPFAIEQEINLYEHDGLRFYHPAQGGEISGCITAGFWAGLYLKTGVAAEYGGEKARPFLISHNTFMDGIKRGSGSQALDRYVGNVIAGGASTMKSLQSVGAALESNYFFDERSLAVIGARKTVENEGSNKVGPPSFLDLKGGNLAIHPALPVSADGQPIGAKGQPVRWMPDIATSLERLGRPAGAAKGTDRPLAPECASSIHGAVITVRLPAANSGRLRYRAAGEKGWHEVLPVSNDLSSAAAVNELAGEPDEEPTEPQSDYSATFALCDGLLQPETAYEFQVEVIGGKVIHSEVQRFITRGGPKEIHVSAEAKANDTANAADGSRERPFAQLQSALDRALPGDTIFLDKGVYTAPAILSHGGTEALPIVIHGSGEDETILDGGGTAPAGSRIARGKTCHHPRSPGTLVWKSRHHGQPVRAGFHRALPLLKPGDD